MAARKGTTQKGTKQKVAAVDKPKVAAGKTKTKSKSARLIAFENDEAKMTLVAGWAKSGLSDKQIAHNMGVAYSTFREWAKLSSALSAVLSKNKEVADFEVENACFKAAKGYYYTTEVDEEVIDKSGRIVKLHKTLKYWMPPNATLVKFWLKNRQPDKWKENRIEVEQQEEAETGLIEIEPVKAEESEVMK